MEARRIKLLVFGLLAALIVYVGLYALFRVIRPEWLNTNDGPIGSFRVAFYPLRYFDSERPAYYKVSRAQGWWLEAKIDWINRGNGYLYFVWSGGEERAAMVADASGFAEGDAVLLHLRYRLETWDDFRSHLIPEVDAVKKKEPNRRYCQRPRLSRRLLRTRRASRSRGRSITFGK